MIDSKTFNDDFNELNILFEQAKNDENNTIYLKSIIIMLVVKLEAFVEDSVVNFVVQLKKIKVKNIPQKIKNEIAKNVLKKVSDVDTNKLINYVDVIKIIAILWDDKFDFKNLDYDFSIKVTNHGGKGINDVFQKIGIDDILNKIDEIDIEDTIYTVSNEINKLINWRHLIIHDNIKTLNATIQDLEIIKKIVLHFFGLVDTKLKEVLENIRNTI